MVDDNDKKQERASCACGGSCCGGPAKWVWLALTVAVLGVLIARNEGKKPTVAAPVANGPPAAAEMTALPKPASQLATPSRSLPRLVDLGAGKCIPCKMMAPILEDLKQSYTGRMDVVFIDVWENPDAGKEYRINMIPTQVFYDADGKELFRHEGFFGKEDILAKWKELGVDL